jgi:hypothetical protein
MRSASIAATLCAAVSSLALAAPAFGGPPPPVTGISSPTPIASYGGRVVYSVPNGTGAYQLVQRIGAGAVTPIPIAPRGVPFDVDLGPTSSGGIYAVYTRCQVEPQWSGFDGLPQYWAGKGCDVYKLDLATNQEVKYTKVNASDASEYYPTYWKGTVAYGRAYDSKPTQPYVYYKKISSSQPSQKLPVGPKGTGQSTALQPEIYGSRVGFGWWYLNGDQSYFQMRVATIGGGSTTVDTSGPGGLSQVVLGWPSFESGKVYWARSCSGDPGGCPGRTRFEQSAYTGTPNPLVAPSPQYVLAHERAGGVTYALSDVNSLYGCATDPATTPQCTLQYLNPSYTPLN